MSEVSAAMEDLNARLTGLAPAARSLAEGAGLPLSRIAALGYAVARAIGMRRAARTGAIGSAALPSRRSRPALAGRRNGGSA
jgi:hypothetical protein